jgi:cyclohexadienyl dehydratase
MRRIDLLVLLASAVAVPRIATAAGVLDEIRTSDVLRVGMTGDYKPYTYRAPDGTWSGLDVDVAHALAGALGVRATFVQTSWPTMTADLLAGKFDIAMGGVSRDSKRAAAGLLTKTYVRDGKVALIRASDAGKFRTFADLDVPSTRVVLNPGGTNESFDREHFHSARLIVVEKNLAIAPLVAAGTYDVMITDGVEAALDVRNDPRLAVMNASHPFTNLEKVYYLPKGASALTAFVDERIAAWEKDGTFPRWRTRWIGSNANAPGMVRPAEAAMR